MNAVMFFTVFFLVMIVLRMLIYGKKRTEHYYDERQIIIRGQAYKVGFVTTLVLDAFFLIYTAMDAIDQYSIAFLAIPIFGGTLAFVGYCIWKDAFISFRNKGTSYIVLSLWMVILQCANLLSSPYWGDWRLLIQSERVINLCCAITFTVILVLLLLKKFMQHGEEE